MADPLKSLLLDAALLAANTPGTGWDTTPARMRLDEFEKRLNHFISKTKENKTITGFGGIEKYYSK